MPGRGLRVWDKTGKEMEERRMQEGVDSDMGWGREKRNRNGEKMNQNDRDGG